MSATPPPPHDAALVRAALALFEEALGLPAADRPDFVRARTAGEPRLRRRALRLLEADESPPPLLSRPLTGGVFEGESPPLRGRRLGRYVLDRVLGRGGMGQVVLARDELLDRDVAIKMFAEGTLHGERGKRRLLSEARAASAIDHPHVCPVHDLGEDDDGLPYIVMAYCEGETLAQRLARGPLPAGEAVAVTLAVAQGLQAAHAKGIVHRDIKPGNIMLTPAGAKLLDFGIADAGGPALTREGALVGTLAYMSPERARGERGDARCDIWSLGAVLFEMVTRTLPFTAGNDAGVLHAILHSPTPRAGENAALDPALARLIERMLQRDPADRYPSMTELIAALDGGTDEGGPSPRIPKRRWRRRAPAVGAAGALVVLAVVALVTPTREEGRAQAEAAAVLDDARVVVLPFRNQTGVDSLRVVAEWAAEWIGLELMQAGVASVVPATAARSAVEMVGGAAAAELDLAAAVAAEFGARIIVAGSIYREADRLEFHARLYDAARGRLVRALEPVQGTVDQPSLGFTDLRTRAVSAVATLTGSEFAAFTALQSQPPTYRAYQEFSRGSELFAQSQYEAAVPYFERAARLDPSYTLPLIYLSHAWGNSGRVRLVAGRIEPVDSILRIVEMRRATLPAYDLNFLEFSWAVSTPHPDWERALRAARELHRIAPGARTDYDVGANLVRLNRPGEAAAFFARLDPERGELRHWAPYWVMLTRAHHMLGDYRAEAAAAQRARSLNPRSGAAHALHLRALITLGETEAALATIDSILAGPPLEGLMTAEHAVEESLLELIAHGHGDAAQRVHALLTQRYEQRLLVSDDPETREDLLFAHVVAEAWQPALDVLGSLRGRTTDDALILGLEGVVMGRTGRIADARARAAELAARDGIYDMGRKVDSGRADLHPRRWAAEVAAAAGDSARAVGFLRAGLAEGLRHGPWLHTAPGLRYLRGYAPFEAVLAPGG
jgi:tetratricopeptide (TPR) repeat protein